MAYNSSHTGAQIDSAVGAVIEKEATWDGKQNALTGKKGQLVGFTSDNVPGAVDAPSGGGGGSHIVMTFATDFVGQAWTLSGGGGNLHWHGRQQQDGNGKRAGHQYHLHAVVRAGRRDVCG